MYEHTKVIVSGNVIEIYRMEKKPFNPHSVDLEDDYNALDITFDKEETKERNEAMRAEMEEKKQNRQAERRLQTVRDARNRARRLILANFDSNDSFITLTYKENMKDISKADNDFKKFMQKVNYRFGKTKYLAVREFQRRGAVHFHLITDDFMNVKNDSEDVIKAKERELAEIWGHGFVDIKPLRDNDNVGAYLIKYMTKDVAVEVFKGKKIYLNSRGLKKPFEYKGEEAEALINAYKLNQKKEVFTNSYESEYLGQINYKEYNLLRLHNQSK